MATIYLALGSNLGERRQNILRAVAQLEKIGIAVEKVSSLIETQPQGGPPQEKFINAVLKAHSPMPALDLLRELKKIETDLGRTPTVPNGPRIIDIDILLYDQVKITSPEMTIPHPRMHERSFVMQPLAEIEPTLAEELLRAHR